MDDYIYAPPSRVMPYGSYQDCAGNDEATWPVAELFRCTEWQLHDVRRHGLLDQHFLR